jgi:hypothetical protein
MLLDYLRYVHSSIFHVSNPNIIHLMLLQYLANKPLVSLSRLAVVTVPLFQSPIVW